MHLEILSKEQTELLPILSQFKREYYLVGGTAIAQKAKEIFKDEFIEKQFIAQLGYFKGINCDEEVVYLIPNPPTETEVQEFLTEISISGLDIL